MKAKVDIDETINKAVKVAIREYDKEKKAEIRKNVFHNTKLLMKHYNDLKSHIENAISEVTELEENMDDICEDEIYILSIKRSKAKSLIMIAHIDESLNLLYKNEVKNGTVEKYLALKKYFIEGKTFECVAEELNCGIITARRWVNEMLNQLGIYLFGIESIF